MTKCNNFYNILIPNEIIIDKDLTDFEKLLYGDIRVLAKKDGYCFATNRYFAERYNKDIRTVQRAIRKLENKTYIVVCNNKDERKIYIFNDYI